MREGLAVRLRQGGPGRPGPGPLRSGVGAGRQREHLGQAERGGHRPPRGGTGHRLARNARRAGQDPPPEDPRRHPGRPLEDGASRRPGDQRHRGHRPGGFEFLPVLLGPLGRVDRHRRPGHGACRGQEPCARRHPYLSGRLPGRVGGAACQRRALGRHASPPCPLRVRPHRRLRRRNRRLARHRRADTGGGSPGRNAGQCRGSGALGRPPADAAPHARAHRGAALRREPAPARLPLPHGRVGQLVGRHGAARGQPALLPQHLRRRCRMAPRPRAGGGCGRRAGRGGDHQARQPVRCRRGRQPRLCLRARPRVRSDERFRWRGRHRR